MTNTQKFEQIFGFVPNSDVCTLPQEVCKRMMEKKGKNLEYVCKECPFVDWWNEEYKKVGHMDASKFPWVIDEQLPGQMTIGDFYEC